MAGKFHRQDLFKWQACLNLLKPILKKKFKTYCHRYEMLFYVRYTRSRTLYIVPIERA